MTRPRRPVDIAVIGDGPAGSALAAACRRLGLDVVLIGGDEDWSATYATWIDDVEALAGADPLGLPALAELLSARVDTVAVHAERTIEVARAYGIFDNDVLRQHLRDGVEHLVGRVQSIRSSTSAGERLEFGDDSTLDARVVIDATGWPSSFARRAGDVPPAWQTALGVVLAEPPPGDLGRPTLMDFRSVRGGDDRPSTVGPYGVTTFCYSLPLRDGWLVEETVLASRPAVEPIALLPRLAARLGRHPDDLLADAIRTEYVRIPMGGSRPVLDQPVVAFGAAAGYVHAATGFSVGSSLRAAPRVAEAIGAAVAGAGPIGPVDSRSIAAAVWPSPFRRSRVLHDYGLEMLLRLDDDEVREFFGAFFQLPIEQVQHYMRIDSNPADVAGVMSQLFRSSSWPMRRRLASGNPVAFARLLRP